MTYWDSSALVPLVVQQDSSTTLRDLHSRDPELMTWTASEIEVFSALCRLRREELLDDAGLQASASRLTNLWARIDAVVAVDAVKQRARRLLRTHALRAADAMQLAAALLAAADDPQRCEFACLDERLAAAARREGFVVVPA